MATSQHPGDVQRYGEILRRAAIALSGRTVYLLESDEEGRLHSIASNRALEAADPAPEELEAAVAQWFGERPVGGRWVASRLRGRRWCVAGVRNAPWQPPPGVERRRAERMTLELAGFCIGLLDATRPAAVPAVVPVQSVGQDRRARQDLEEFFENVPVGVHWAAADGTILGVNQAELDLLGYARDEYVGHNVAEFHADPAVAAEYLLRMGAGETLRDFPARMRHRDGSIREVTLSSNARIENGQFVNTRCVTRDVTERAHAEEQLLHGALHDPLTDLPNRAFFLERVAQALTRAGADPDYKFAVLFLDCDRFKVVNDSLGHAAGDLLLKGMADRLRACVRPLDVVARFGGDEFTLLLEDVASHPGVEEAAQRIRESFKQPFVLDGRKVFVAASVGVALSTTTFGGPDDLVRAADIAMYRAKALGRGRHQIFTAGMLRRARTRFGTEADLRGAVERAEFRLVYQPIIELRTARVHGFEALLRWHHPERGVIQPPTFIPVAEETGLIVPIGHWVLRESCAQARRWQALYPGEQPVRISVNVSARQLGTRHIVDDVRQTLSDTGLEPSSLQMEITETVLMDSVAEAIARLGELSELGVGLQVDDFGTGYSSLGLLPRVPLQTVKIDRSFIRRLGLRRTDHELVASILDLVKRLGLSTIAEGVETAGQCERLIALGCTLGQGFYFAGPLDAEAAGALVARRGTSREVGAVRPVPIASSG